MRRLLATTIIVAVAVALIPAAGSADPYKWCAVYGGDEGGGGTNCGFVTIEQCRATVSGIGGSCDPNPFYNYPADRPTRSIVLSAGPRALGQHEDRSGLQRWLGSEWHGCRRSARLILFLSSIRNEMLQKSDRKSALSILAQFDTLVPPRLFDGYHRTAHRIVVALLNPVNCSLGHPDPFGKISLAPTKNGPCRADFHGESSPLTFECGFHGLA